MRGNLHVRFLGEGVAARPPPYPPDAEGSIPFARSTADSERPDLYRAVSSWRKLFSLFQQQAEFIRW